jgi:hypothetical protein
MLVLRVVLVLNHQQRCTIYLTLSTPRLTINTNNNSVSDAITNFAHLRYIRRRMGCFMILDVDQKVF